MDSNGALLIGEIVIGVLVLVGVIGAVVGGFIHQYRARKQKNLLPLFLTKSGDLNFTDTRKADHVSPFSKCNLRVMAWDSVYQTTVEKI